MEIGSRTLGTLANVAGGVVSGSPETVVTDVTNDSRRVEAGSLYVAVRGEHVDGHEFVAQAVEAGASAVCVSHPVAVDAPQLLVKDTRGVQGLLAAEVHDHPSHSLEVVGVTGTNGKTTVTHYVESIAMHSGLRTGLIGTIHTRIGESTVPAGLTTPDAPDFQRFLALMREEGVSVAAVEVSSHALELGRVGGTRFSVAAFTNISQDHLDFHGDMGSYRSAKKRLFTDFEVGTAVINIDDDLGSEIAAGYRGDHYTVGRDGDFSVQEIEPLAGGRSRVRLRTPMGAVDEIVPVVGGFNVLNLVLASACAVAAGIEFAEVVEALPYTSGVPGRFEVVSGDDPITVIVDFAHTPEAVARAVDVGRSLATGRVVGLVGAGGDRDRRKRPAMGSAISAADFALITSDNPRSEDPEAIIAAVAEGLPPGASHVIEVDRRTAIQLAVDTAEDGDVVLILGRGHETHQHTGTGDVAFDDRVVAADALARKRGAAESDGSSGSMST